MCVRDCRPVPGTDFVLKEIPGQCRVPRCHKGHGSYFLGKRGDGTKIHRLKQSFLQVKNEIKVDDIRHHSFTMPLQTWRYTVKQKGEKTVA